jgi:predicted ATPase
MPPAKQGNPVEGVAKIRAGLAAERASGSEIGYPQFSALLVEALMETGNIGEALAAATTALAVADRTGAASWNSELYRLKGELLLMNNQRVDAEACFRKAIGIAQRQETKSFELRAVMSLARLLETKGERGNARQILGTTYGWFSEGFDTADLKDAKALLDEIS